MRAVITYPGHDCRAARLIRRAIAGLGMLALLVAPSLAAASPTAPASRPQTEEELHRLEVAALGPAHAAEHARERRLQREADARSTIPGERSPLALATRALALLAPRDVGLWTASAPLPIVAVHAVLLPTGKILLFTYDPADGTRGFAAVWDPETGTSRRVDPPSDLWCAGQAVLADGRVVVVGGNLASSTGNLNNKGLNQIWVFNPVNETWIRQPDMRRGRWYPTATRLPNGKVLITSGYDETGTRTIDSDIEVFTPSSDPDGVGTVELLGDRTFALYPHQFVIPDGRVAVAGPGMADPGILDPATGAWTGLPGLSFDRTTSSAVLQPAGPLGSGRMLLFGGNTARVDAIDALSPAPAWQPLAPLPQKRRNLNTVILPDGTLLTVGGNSLDKYDQPQLESLLYDPQTDQWTPMASQADPRGYHSTALLLPDGRVWSAGDDGPFSGGNSTDTYEIFSPPYLFRGPRPTITSAPAAVPLGSTFAVGTPDDVVRATLVALGSTTHANDMNQRLISLTPVRRPDGTGVDLAAPGNANVALPGQYMLFLLNDAGVPSVARILRITGATPPPQPTSAVRTSCRRLTARALTSRCATFRRGTARADVLAGTPEADRLIGLAGNDLLIGRGGDDSLEGGPGNDRLLAGGGNDWLEGGAGRDVYVAGPGNDVIRSRDGVREVVACGAGRDTVIADRLDAVIGCEHVQRH